MCVFSSACACVFKCHLVRLLLTCLFVLQDLSGSIVRSENEQSTDEGSPSPIVTRVARARKTVAGGRAAGVTLPEEEQPQQQQQTPAAPALQQNDTGACLSFVRCLRWCASVWVVTGLLGCHASVCLCVCVTLGPKLVHTRTPLNLTSPSQAHNHTLAILMDQGAERVSAQRYIVDADAVYLCWITVTVVAWDAWV